MVRSRNILMCRSDTLLLRKNVSESFDYGVKDPMVINTLRQCIAKNLLYRIYYENVKHVSPVRSPPWRKFCNKSSFPTSRTRQRMDGVRIFPSNHTIPTTLKMHQF